MSIFEKIFWTAFLAFQRVRQTKYPFIPRERILKDRDRNIRRMIRFAYRNVPYYRKLFDEGNLKPGDIRNACDLESLPIIEREILREAPHSLSPENLPMQKCLPMFSGGSTGIPVQIMHHRSAVFQTAAHQQRYRQALREGAGKRIDRETLIATHLSTYKTFYKFILDRTYLLGRMVSEKQVLSLFDSPEKNASLINDFKPDAILSYGSYLEGFFGWLETSGQKMFLPKIVGFGADMLPNRARALIRNKFGSEVFSSYNSVEAQRIAFECPAHTGLHVNEDAYVVRIVDSFGRTLPDGETGEVVITNLVNRGTVLINYRLGDLAALISSPCSCGRSLALMTYPKGRSSDLIRLQDGRVIHPQEVEEIVQDPRDSMQYQVIQESFTKFLVLLVLFDDSRRSEIEERFRPRFRDLFGADAEVVFRFEKSIPRTEAGKFRPVISRVRSDGY